MSGVELIVGAVLGSVPIALEAYDRSGRLFETISTFRHYAKEVDLLDAKLSTQRIIYRNNAINLLTAVTQDRDSVQELSDQVDNVLQELCGQFETIRCEVGTVSQKLSTPEWFKHVRSRIKLGLSKPQIEKAIKRLRALNGDFESIASHIIAGLRQLSLDSRGGKHDASHQSFSGRDTLQKYRRIRGASKAIHSTLQERWMCSSHPSHSFALNIVGHDTATGEGKGKAHASHYVTCELATVPGQFFSPTEAELRLEIEQVCDSDDENQSLRQQGDVQRVAEFQQLAIALETNVGEFRTVKSTTPKAGLGRLFRGIPTSDKRLPGPVEAAVARSSDLPQSVAVSAVVEPMSTAAVPSPTPNPPAVMDFCRELRILTSDCIQRSLVATWELPRAQWFHIPEAAIQTQNTSQSISDLIQWIAEKPVVRSLSRPASVEMASRIAEGIMQFYSTPWLVDSDLGQNVRYFNSAPVPSDAVKLKGPYFAAEFRGSRSAEHPRAGPATLNAEGEPGGIRHVAETARNKLLFSFGILLLEIAYGRPWGTLRKSVTGSEMPPNEAIADYRAAEKLAHLLVNQMGSNFPRIVKKCLGCDFGLGETDLDNEDLQRHFVKDIVAGLERLESHMRQMDLALED
ncbi:predicted protein [Verticillium alfalfae VaMs.102]|uniref:Predicted protein n=1 Tax=Verticillium alfalfae (strain VaMs.102 / ATCC MYA-4576 / FGSC 10136) TaxID=526221 RepID=C9SP06_VERA1|nr:predicted protein [Verticillium alfalfae VaMs.102]EEY20521.1 predicted protein [Verticillium alfalfae VaMs.102]